ncbi:MAG: hypothetical protein KJ621_05240 [Proteobacteria bacterium]|nr:hypothetical protein [Pseudomonadota bacterium]
MTRKIWVLSTLVVFVGLAWVESIPAFSVGGTKASSGKYCPGTDPNYMPPSLQYIRRHSVGLQLVQYRPPAYPDQENNYSPPPGRYVSGYGPPPRYQPPHRRFGPPPPGPQSRFGYRRFGPPPRWGMRPRPRWGDPVIRRLRFRLRQVLGGLRAEIRGPNPSRERAMSLVREINSLRSRILQRRVLNRLRHRSIAPRHVSQYGPPPRYLPGGSPAYAPVPRPYRAAPPSGPAFRPKGKTSVKFPEPQRWW